MKDRIGAMLLRAGIIDRGQLESGTEYARTHGVKVYSALTKLGFISGNDLQEFLSMMIGEPTVSLEDVGIIDPDVVNLIDEETARKYQLIPFDKRDSVLMVAMVDPTDVDALENLKFNTGLNIEPCIATESDIRKALAEYYDTGEADLDAEVEGAEALEQMTSQLLVINGNQVADKVVPEMADDDDFVPTLELVKLISYRKNGDSTTQEDT